ncbi:Hypothetical protein A7982_01512 [Minicystis rosea]|nr:Hypothetical protein A7982_01512 [Minicystis rosea]
MASDRAGGRAFAAVTTAVVMAYKLSFGSGLLTRPSLLNVTHALLLWGATFVTSLFFGRIVAQARSGRGAVGRSIGLGMIGGALVLLVTFPLAHVGSTWAPGLTRAHILVNDVLGGAFLGFFIGLGVAPLAFHHARLRQGGSLDFLPRIYVAAGAQMIVPCLATSLTGTWIPCLPLLAGSFAMTMLAARANRRRLDWLARVHAGEAQGHRLDETHGAAETATLPGFVGEARKALGVLSRAGESEAERAAHPFRAGEAWIPVARVPLDASATSIEAQLALRQSTWAGGLAGLLALFFLGLPMLMMVIALST